MRLPDSTTCELPLSKARDGTQGGEAPEDLNKPKESRRTVISLGGLCFTGSGRLLRTAISLGTPQLDLVERMCHVRFFDRRLRFGHQLTDSWNPAEFACSPRSLSLRALQILVPRQQDSSYSDVRTRVTSEPTSPCRTAPLPNRPASRTAGQEGWCPS